MCLSHIDVSFSASPSPFHSYLKINGKIFSGEDYKIKERKKKSIMECPLRALCGSFVASSRPCPHTAWAPGPLSHSLSPHGPVLVGFLLSGLPSLPLLCSSPHLLGPDSCHKHPWIIQPTAEPSPLPMNKQYLPLHHISQFAGCIRILTCNTLMMILTAAIALSMNLP